MTNVSFETNMALDAVCLFVTALLIVCLALAKSQDIHLKRLFIAMLVVNGLVLFADATTWVWDGRADRVIALQVAHLAVYSLGYVIVGLFTAYLVRLIGLKRSLSRRIIGSVAALCAAAVVLTLLVADGLYFRIDGQGGYERGPLYWMSQLVAVFIVLVDMGIVARYRKELGAFDAAALLSYGLLPVAALVAQVFAFGSALLHVAVTMSLLIVYVTIQIAQDDRLRRQELELANSRISIMLLQIRPHFLFNALTAIKSLCASDPASAEEAVSEFAAYLRGNLDGLALNGCVPIERELEHVEAYLSLERRCFGDGLRVEFDLASKDFSVPPLTVQPLVENAVRHGIAARGGGGTVRVATREEPDAFVVAVSDDGAGIDGAFLTDGKNHLGMESVQQRLRELCGGSLTVQGASGGGTTARISIPKGPEKKEASPWT